MGIWWVVSLELEQDCVHTPVETKTFIDADWAHNMRVEL